MKCKHYYKFENHNIKSLDKEGWEVLRNDGAGTPFSVEKTVREYEEYCEKADSYVEAAKIIEAMLKKCGAEDNKIVSLGCGKGVLEYHLKKIHPNRSVKCTDYTEDAILKLQKVFVGCDEFLTFDMLSKNDYCDVDGGDTVLLCRVSTEFTSNQWKQIFLFLHEAGVENVVFIPTEILTLREVLMEKVMHCVRLLRYGRKGDTFCGWKYDEKEFAKFWADKYYIRDSKYYDNTVVWLLSMVN